jgi:hypothetical protein
LAAKWVAARVGGALALDAIDECAWRTGLPLRERALLRAYYVVYLKDVFTRLPTQPASRIYELLPHCWKPDRCS